MTETQKIQLRQSECREAINKLMATDKLTDEQRTTLATLTEEAQGLEVKYRAAVTKEAEEAEQRAAAHPDNGTDGESAEIRQLKRKAEVRHYLAGAVAGRGLDGALGEFNDALKLPRTGPNGGVQIPWVALEVPQPRRAEARADAVTGTAQLDGPTMQRPIMQRLFGRDILDAVGLRLDAVPQGMTEWPLLTGGVAPAQKSEKAAAPDAAQATFDTQTLKPRRLTGRYVYTVEQQAQIPDIEMALRLDLADAVRSEMSNQAINGTGVAPQVMGLLGKLADPTDPSAASSYAVIVGTAAQGVDGIHAYAQSEVCVILGPDSYRYGTTLYTNAGEVSALMQLENAARLVVASSYIPDPAGNQKIQTVLLHSGADAMRGDSIGAVWPTLEVIRDPYSAAGNGQVALTWITLWDAYMAFRAGAYKRLEWRMQ